MADRLRARSTPARMFLLTVVLSGGASIVVSAEQLLSSPPPPSWLILGALTLLTGSFSIKVPGLSARISVSEAFVFAAILSFGPAVGTIIVALDALVVTLWLRGENRSLIRVFFNVAAGSLAIWASGHLFELLVTSNYSNASLKTLLAPTLLLALSYFAINSTLIAIAVSLDRKMPAFALWRRNFLWLSLNYLGGASVALLIVTNTRELDMTALSVIVPLLIITYLTLRTSLGRLDDATKHVAQVNDLYLSTIEALAMAVDAKDQITHGHIRRVQVYAVELAKRLGVSDEAQLKAIETAALLHDMGKLAIPEHILNKPGRLTEAEFEKMKRHADIGADLLASIKFPYPVVPIVRHHHENWDGRGYPAGIAGADIPLGARILAVVDCFDALTSDRPYRPRLSTDEAFCIIGERRGSAYDPLVVDTFTSAYADIAPLAIRAGQDAKTLFGPPEPTGRTGHQALKEIRANATEATLLADCAKWLQKAATVPEAFEVATQTLRQLTPATTYSLYSYDGDSDSLVCSIAAGDTAHLLNGLVIRVGQRVSGWVAANRRGCINADAALDLNEIAEQFSPALRSATASPITHGARLLGVLTGYSHRDDAFGETHMYALELVASMLSEHLRRSTSISRTVVSLPRANRWDDHG